MWVSATDELRPEELSDVTEVEIGSVGDDDVDMCLEAQFGVSY